jgi:hypothetical protein
MTPDQRSAIASSVVLIEQAQAEIEELQRVLDLTRRAGRADNEDNERLRAALKRYGRHSGTCGYWPSLERMHNGEGSIFEQDATCTCGLDAALAVPQPVTP